MSTFTYPSQSVSISGAATEANQLTMITELQDVNTELDAQSTTLTSLDGKDFSTEATLAALNAKVTAVDTTDKATATNQTTANASLSTIAGDTTSLDSKVTKADTDNVTVSSSALPTGASTAANQSTMVASLTNMEADLDALNARLAGSLVPDTFDEIELAYVTAGNGIGEIFTAIYKLSTVTVATLTLSYDASNRLVNVTRS